MSELLVQMDNVSKSYGPVDALGGVNLKVYRGEVVGLLGDNGAGKSTLIKVLSGAVKATGGTISIKGKTVEMNSTTDAIDHGIETIYQDSALVTPIVDCTQSVSRTGADQRLEIFRTSGRRQDGGRCLRAFERSWYFKGHSANNAHQRIVGRRATGRGDCPGDAF